MKFKRLSPTHSRPGGNASRQNVGACLVFAALVLLPLIYLNASLVRLGFRPPEPGFNIELAQPSGVVHLDENGE